MVLRLRVIDTPIGPLTVVGAGADVCLLHFGAVDDGVRSWLARWYPGAPIEAHADPAGAVGKLQAYFAGDLQAIDTIAVSMHGTPFQQRVWDFLRRIRSGRTASYADVARSIGSPTAVRAVGAANGANPVAVVVPCHRVIGTNGSLTGYGGGLDRKRWLLAHEQPPLAGLDRGQVVQGSLPLSPES